ncbi:hypothetical protein U1Q18_014709 [Sarracenia purpurea var. burkii]
MILKSKRESKKWALRMMKRSMWFHSGQGHLLPSMELNKHLASRNYKTTFIISSNLSSSVPSSLCHHARLCLTIKVEACGRICSPPTPLRKTLHLCDMEDIIEVRRGETTAERDESTVEMALSSSGFGIAECGDNEKRRCDC